MNPEVQVKDALRALAEQDSGLEAKASASQIFARRQPQQNWRRRVTIAAVGLAAAAALLVSIQRARTDS